MFFRFGSKSGKAVPPAGQALEEIHYVMIGVGRTDWLRSLPPPNRTGGSPAYGSPVDGLTSERVDGPRRGLVPD